MPPKRASPSPTPEEDNGGPTEASTLSEEVWKGMQDLLTHIYDYRTGDGYDPSKIFQRKVNKRALPGYYDVISEPVALSTIKQKINTRSYLTVKDCVRDFALIPHNAFVYNLPDSGAYQDAVIVKEQIEAQLKKLVKAKVFSAEDAELPYLGEIPAADEQAVEEEEEEEDEEEEEEEEEEEADDDLGDDPPKKRGRGRPRKSSIVKRDIAKDDNDPETRKKRGRPPKVLTPTELRIQTVLKGIRKPKGKSGQAMIVNFERVPDKAVMPEYFHEIKNPMAYDILKRKYKRKKYQNLEQFLKDVDLMFENAKQYNTDESELYQDAVKLQAEAHRLADEVKARPDTDYIGDEGRLPMPGGILHNGELYKTGDWVLIQNVNDLTKPIPCQIYRTYQDAQGGKWVNVCWYYRPEQTIHRFDKHFFENEVAKTGQYRDHRIDELVGRCFIMFVTRYFKGRPVNLPPDTEVFVCESRYNEEKHTFNKIKTWASCLPDEVRDKNDYAMDQFAAPRRMKKFPSPLAYLLKDEQKEEDELPKAEWGAENAPPKIGAVHRRPRDPRDSPPPEPTPPPPPTPPPAPVQRAPDPPQRPAYSPMQSNNAQMSASANGAQRQSYPQQYSSSVQNIQARPYQSQQQYPTAGGQQLRPTQMQQSAPQQSSIPTNPYLRAEAAGYRGPPPIEVYTLPDTANYSIPEEIRDLFQRDDADRVLFFTAPPSYTEDKGLKPLRISKDAPSTKEEFTLGHSARYLAVKARRADELAQKRADHEREREAEFDLKRKRQVDEDEKAAGELQRLKQRALHKLQSTLEQSVKGDFKAVYGKDWEKTFDQRVAAVEQVKAHAQQKAALIESAKDKDSLHEPVGWNAFGSVAEE